MALSKEELAACIKKFGRNESDSGSPEVQIAILSARINKLYNDHCVYHNKDLPSRRGLLGMVTRRRKMLDYLKRSDVEKYRLVISKLGLRK